MSEDLIIFIFIISFFIIISPIYYQNRRTARMADEDLKKINFEEWKKQITANVYIKMFSRIIWGLVILSGLIFNFSKIYALGFRWINVFVSALGIAFIVLGIIGFRRDIKRVRILN